MVRPMPATMDDLLAYLDSLGLKVTTVHHPPVFTVEEAKRLRGELAGGHCKCLFLKDKKDRLFLVVADEDRAVDLKALRQALGAGTLSFGKPELLREVLGVEPGSVTPFSLINDRDRRATVVLDEAMMEQELLNYHPLTNRATTTIRSADLTAFIASLGHEVRQIRL
jgi:Ala-tRNA(Pro) deacylase